MTKINFRRVAWIGLAITLVAPTFAADRSNNVVIEHVTLIDGTGRPPRADTTVVVENGVFTRIDDSKIAKRSAATVIDGRGKFLIPGMMDMHIHLLGAGAWRDSSAQSERPVDYDVEIGRAHV